MNKDGFESEAFVIIQNKKELVGIEIPEMDYEHGK